MKNKILIIFSLMLFVLVLMGVTIIEPITTNYKFLQPFIPMIVITGFFTFLVAAGLFVYSIINNLKK
jgi:hypothetical protein